MMPCSLATSRSTEGDLQATLALRRRARAACGDGGFGLRQLLPSVASLFASRTLRGVYAVPPKAAGRAMTSILAKELCAASFQEHHRSNRLYGAPGRRRQSSPRTARRGGIIDRLSKIGANGVVSGSASTRGFIADAVAFLAGPGRRPVHTDRDAARQWRDHLTRSLSKLQHTLTMEIPS